MTEKDWKQEIIKKIRYRGYYPVDKPRFFNAIKEALNLAVKEFIKDIDELAKNSDVDGRKVLFQFTDTDLYHLREKWLCD